MAKRRRHVIAPESAIDMTPMIDVVFQLILFFMLTSNLIRPNQIELELPESTSGVKAAEETHLVVVYRSANGVTEIQLNGAAVENLGALPAAMQAVSDPRLSPHVDLRIDKLVSYQEVISLMDTVRDAGYPKFSLQTIQPDSPLKGPRKP